MGNENLMLTTIAPNHAIGMTGEPGLTRLSAAGIHLGISAGIAAAVLAVIYMAWYPAPYFTAMGGDQLVLLVVGVDVVIGPLITLIIFKPDKPGLRFDLGVIAFLQATALAYGVTIAASARPVYSVFVVDRFETVSANAIEPSELKQVRREEFKSLPWFGPKLAGAVKPEDARESNRILFALTEGRDLQHFPQHFVPYDEIAAEVGRRAQSIGQLKRLNFGRAPEIDAFLLRHHVTPTEVGFVPLRARRAELVVIVRRTGVIVGTMELSPWG